MLKAAVDTNKAGELDKAQKMDKFREILMHNRDELPRKKADPQAEGAALLGLLGAKLGADLKKRVSFAAEHEPVKVRSNGLV